MATPTHTTPLVFSLLIFSFLYASTLISSASAAASATSPAASFVRASCRATTYPAVCVQSLSTYAASINKNPKYVDRAESTKTFVAKLTRFRGLKPREKSALKDCLEESSIRARMTDVAQVTSNALALVTSMGTL
ncbi:hypothetical protein ACS0TY_011373 [Phlomoides rotata]